MGVVTVRVELENFVDRTRANDGSLAGSEVRSFETLAMVDTGAVMNMLRQDVIEHLGVPVKDHAVITLEDERRTEMPVASGVTFKVSGRSTTLPCLVGPPRSEAFLGQILLAVLDLVVECPGGRVFPNPESPIYPSLKPKWFDRPFSGNT